MFTRAASILATAEPGWRRPRRCLLWPVGCWGLRRVWREHWTGVRAGDPICPQFCGPGTPREVCVPAPRSYAASAGVLGPGPQRGLRASPGQSSRQLSADSRVPALAPLSLVVPHGHATLAKPFQLVQERPLLPVDSLAPHTGLGQATRHLLPCRPAPGSQPPPPPHGQQSPPTDNVTHTGRKLGIWKPGGWCLPVRDPRGDLSAQWAGDSPVLSLSRLSARWGSSPASQG